MKDNKNIKNTGNKKDNKSRRIRGGRRRMLGMGEK
jgi:hypothetical protein